MYTVAFKNVSRYYNNKKILNNISLNIPDNKITAVIGRSGSGKSTLLKLINGLVIPSEGEIRLFGNVVNYNLINELRLQIGYSVQGTTLFPHMTVFENITLLAKLKNHSQEEIDERLDILLKFVNIPREFINKYPYQLSGGEQQRVGLCRAMMLNPKLILLDEAFGALDPTTKSEIHIELLKIQLHEPRTIVIVTHDLQEAFKLADQIIIIENGIIQQTGTKEEIKNSPVEFVNYFVRSQFE